MVQTIVENISGFNDGQESTHTHTHTHKNNSNLSIQNQVENCALKLTIFYMGTSFHGLLLTSSGAMK